VRGACAATHPVEQLLAPTTYPADKLLAVECITPACTCLLGRLTITTPRGEGESGCWRSCTTSNCRPPPCRRPAPMGQGVALAPGVQAPTGHRPVAGGGQGDVVLVPRLPRRRHRALVRLYYLNVLAGPSPDAPWRFANDPPPTVIRLIWDGKPTDPEVPYPLGFFSVPGEGNPFHPAPRPALLRRTTSFGLNLCRFVPEPAVTSPRCRARSALSHGPQSLRSGSAGSHGSRSPPAFRSWPSPEISTEGSSNSGA